MHAQFSIVPRSPCAIMLINPIGTCLYLLMGFNVYLGPLVQVDGATSISTVSLVDVEIGSFSPYIFVPTHWAKHTKTTIREAPSLGNPSCSKLDFSHPSLVVAITVAVTVAAALPSPVLRHCRPASRALPSYHCTSLSPTGAWSPAVRQDVAVTVVLSAAATSPAAVRVSSRAVINLRDGHVDVSPPSVLFHN